MPNVGCCFPAIRKGCRSSGYPAVYRARRSCEEGHCLGHVLGASQTLERCGLGEVADGWVAYSEVRLVTAPEVAFAISSPDDPPVPPQTPAIQHVSPPPSVRIRGRDGRVHGR